MEFDLSLEPRYGELVPLSPLIGRVLAPNPGPYTFRGTGVYIIGAGQSIAVIDPGPDMPEHVEALKRVIGSRQLSHILITHTHLDHSPAARPLREWSGAKTYAFGPHRQGSDAGLDSGTLFVPDVCVADGDLLPGRDFTLECVFTPGHASNHMCYALHEEKALFTGDHVMGWSTSVIAPPDGNMGAYMASLEKLIARDDAMLYPTHGSPIPEPGRLLKAYLSHRRMREAQIAALLSRGEQDIAAIVARLYAGLQPKLVPAAALTVRAHLEHMAEDGRVRRDGENWKIA